MKKFVDQEFGPNQVTVKFVDVFSAEIHPYDKYLAWVEQGRVRLPLTLINCEPRFHAGFSSAAIATEVERLLEGDN